MPRVDYRPFVKHHYHRDIWKAFEERYKDTPLLDKVDRGTFWNITKDYFKLIGNHIVKEAGIYHPIVHNKEHIRLIRKKTNPKKMYIDFAHYNKTGEIAYHFNQHSGGYYYSFNWERYLKPSFTGLGIKMLYNYFPANDLKRLISKSIKEGDFNFNIE